MNEKRIVLTKFVEGQTSFMSKGVSVLKVIIDGEENQIVLPIKSMGVAETQERITLQIPKPPIKTMNVVKGSKEAKELGLTSDTAVKIFDHTDKDYLEALDKHNQDAAWRTAICGLDLEFVSKDGQIISNENEKIEILKKSGITVFHMLQICRDINYLTSNREEVADFLSVNTLV